MTAPATREGNLEASTRHPLNWNNPAFYDKAALNHEMERVFDFCVLCRGCVSLCESFPTLFDLVDGSPTMEVTAIEVEDYWKVVEHCYLCDLCFKYCPYVPTHELTIDFPHLMLRAKAVHFKKGTTRLRDKVLTSTDAVGRLAGIPVVAQTVNAVNNIVPARKALQAVAGIHADAWLPEFSSRPLRSRLEKLPLDTPAEAAGSTRGKVALFATCYMNRNEPGPGEDLAAVFAHNGIPVTLAEKERCCGMPKLELGDLESVRAAKEANIPVLAKLVDAGWDLTALVPSCVLMFKQELPLMFPDDPDVLKVKNAFYDPFEYLMLRHREGRLKTDFKSPLGKVSYHAACHQRAQNIGPKTKEVLSLVPGTEVGLIERCSGHGGIYAIKKESHDYAVKIVELVVERVNKAQPDHYGSDCALAGHHIGHVRADDSSPEHPITLLRKAYRI